MIEKIIEKIDNYNLFTNIIPGFMLLLFNKYYFGLFITSTIEQLIIAYLLGLTLNKIGSIFIEKILLKLFKIKNEYYNDYIKASKNDEKISILVQERNVSRTLCALTIICLAEISINLLMHQIKIPIIIIIISSLIILLIIYSLSFIKYNGFIVSRIKSKTK